MSTKEQRIEVEVQELLRMHCSNSSSSRNSTEAVKSRGQENRGRGGFNRKNAPPYQRYNTENSPHETVRRPERQNCAAASARR